MRYAIYNGKRAEAISGAVGHCECCNAEVQGCHGGFHRYWRHINMEDCDTWAEGETQWHIDWKQRFTASKSREEVLLRKDGQRGHRADVLTPRHVVVELQHSFLSAEELRDREEFYRQHAEGMIWLFDLTEKTDNFELTLKENFYTFRWKHMRLTSLTCGFPRYLDLGDDRIFEICKLYKEKAVRGWGKLYTYIEFVQRVEGRGQAKRRLDRTQLASPHQVQAADAALPQFDVKVDRPMPTVPVRPASTPKIHPSLLAAQHKPAPPPVTQSIQPRRQIQRGWSLLLLVAALVIAALVIAGWRLNLL